MKKQDRVLLKNCVKGEAKNKIIEELLQQEVPLAVYDRISHFLKILNKSRINLVLLKSLAFSGVPTECRGLRGIIWRLLFGQLPPEPQKWEDFLKMRHAQYNSFKKDLVIIPTLPKAENEPENLTEVTDHPLSLSKDSRWFMFYKDDDARKQINKDIKRTRRDVGLFKEPTQQSEESKSHSLFIPSTAQIMGLDNDEEDLISSEGETHKHVLARILLIYSKLNQGVNYVQGMNELLAVIYYCLHQYSQAILQPFLESDAFFCFSTLMGEVRDEYMRELDTEDSGIKGKLRLITELLHTVDPEYHEFFKGSRIAIDTFALRWVMLFLAQDFSIEKVIRLWDTLISDPDKYSLFNYVILQLILDGKQEVIAGEPHLIPKVMLQVTKGVDVVDLLERAGKLLAKDQDKEEYNVKQYQ